MLRNHAEPPRSRGFVTTRLAAGIAGAIALTLLLWWALRPSVVADPDSAQADGPAGASGAEAEFEAYAGGPAGEADEEATPPSAHADSPNPSPAEAAGVEPPTPSPPAGEPVEVVEGPRVVYTPPPAQGGGPAGEADEVASPSPFPGGPNDRGPRVGSVSGREQALRIENPLPDERGAARPDLAFYQELDASYDGLAQALTGCARGLAPDTTDSLFVELTVTANPDNPAQGVATVDLFGSEVLTEGRAACAQSQIRALPLPAPSHARSGESGRYTVHAETAAEYSVIFEFSMGDAEP